MPTKYDVSAAGVRLIAFFEAFRANAYQDQAGVWTIGYGHTLGVTAGMVFSREQALASLKEDCRTAVASVNRFLTNANLTQAQFDACVSLTFNIGVRGFESSSVRTLINAGDLVGAAAAFTAWHKTGVPGKPGQLVPNLGLVRRRLIEGMIFSGAELGAYQEYLRRDS